MSFETVTADPIGKELGAMGDAVCRGRMLSVAEMLDIYAAPNLLAAVRSALEAPGNIEIDLGGSTTIHSAALQVLVALVRSARDGDRSVTFTGLSDEVSALWQSTGLDAVLATARAFKEVAAA